MNKRKPLTEEQREKHRISNRIVMRNWRINNPEKAKERNRKYRVERREQWIASYTRAGKKYKEKDPERWRRMQIEAARSPHRIAKTRQYTKAHAAESAVRVRKWKKLNPGRRKAHSKNAKARRRAKLLQNGAIFSCSDKIELLNKECFCRWCCTPLSNDNRTIDHVVPIARGGAHHPDNLAAACDKCNFSKGKKLISEWTWKEAA